MGSMKITVLGANGKTGVKLVKQALAEGVSVTGLVRQAGMAEDPNLTFVIGDATSADDVRRASRGSDAIISVLGTASLRSTLMTDAVKAVIAASKTTGVRRFILMSNLFGAGNSE